MNLTKVVHDYSSVPDVSLDDIEEGRPVQAQELGQAFRSDGERLRPVAENSDLPEDLALLGFPDHLQPGMGMSESAI